MENEKKQIEALVHINEKFNSFIKQKQKQIEEIKQNAKTTKDEIIKKILSILEKNSSSKSGEIQDNYTEQKLLEEIEKMKKDYDLKTSSLLQSTNNEKNVKDELEKLKKEVDNKESLTKSQIDKMKKELEEKESKIRKFRDDIKSSQFGLSLIKYFDDKDNSNNYANELDQKWKVQDNKIKDLEKQLTNVQIEKDNKINDLEKQFQNLLKEEESKTQKLNEKLKEIQNEKDKLIKESKEQLQESQNLVNETKTKEQELEKQLKQIKNEKENKINELRKQLEEVQNEKDKLIKESKEQLQESQNLVNETKTKEQELEKQLKQIKNEKENKINELKKQLEEVQNENKKKLKDSENQSNEFKDKLKKEEEKRKKIEEQLNESQNLLKEKEKKEQQLDSQLKQNENEKEKTINELNEKLQEAKKDKEKKINDLNEQLEQMHNTLKDMENQVNRFISDINNTKFANLKKYFDKNDNLKTNYIKELETTINQQINKLESDLEALQKEIQKKDDEISKDKDTFVKTKAALEKQINDERENSKTISNNLSQLKKDNEKQIQKLNDDITKLKNEIKQKEEEIQKFKDNLLSRNKTLEKKLTIKNSKNNDYIKSSDKKERGQIKLQDIIDYVSSKIEESKFTQEKEEKEKYANNNLLESFCVIEKTDNTLNEYFITILNEIQDQLYNLPYVNKFWKKGTDKTEIISIETANTTNLLSNEGWKVKGSTKANYSSTNIIIGILGNSKSGKTHILNEIFGTYLEETPTKSINLIYNPDHANLVIIDTPGLKYPTPCLRMYQPHTNETKRRDCVIETFVYELSSIIIYVTNHYNYDSQKQINQIKRRFSLQVDKNNDSVIKTFIVLHNIPTIETKNEYDEYISDFILTNDQTSMKQINDDTITETIFDKERNKSLAIIHLVYCPYNRNKVIDRIRNQIKTCSVKPALDISKTIKVGFEAVAVNMLNALPNSVNLENGKLYIKNGKIDEKKEFDKTTYWKHFENVIPNYAYCVNKDNTRLLIQIEVVEMGKCTVTAKIVNKNNVFSFIIEKKKNSYASTFSNRKEGEYRLEMKIPLRVGVLQKYNYSEKTYENGLLTLIYPITKPNKSSNSDSDDEP